ncbi:TBC1 domain family member 12 [Pholidichthys leucotaenia]
METPGENAGAFVADLNESEEVRLGGGRTGAGKVGHKSPLKDRSAALFSTRVSGGRAVGKAGFHVTSNGGAVNTDDGEIMLDVVVPGQVTDSCVISGVCADHSGLNGFESPGQEDEEEGGGRGETTASSTSAATAPASCPAVLRDRLSRGLRRLPAGESGGGAPEEEASVGACPPAGRLQRSTKEQPDSPASSHGIMANGLDGHGGPEVSLLWEKLCLCEEATVANGRLHARLTQDWLNSDHLNVDQSGQETRRDFLYPESSANASSPCPSSDSPLSEPVTREDVEEDEELWGPSLPIRPQTLRTNPNAVPVSLSCDATPLSPDDKDCEGFYLREGAWGQEEEEEEDFRGVVQDAGRRQSAPDTVPDLSERLEDSDSAKQMPKRFGIAEFFTRSLFSRKAKESKPTSHNASGWRLFSKTAAREGDPSKDPDSTVTVQQDPQQEQSSFCPQRPPAAGRRKNLEFEPLSTTALILEDRPANLPAKPEEETQRHKLEYEEMVAGAKRRELKEAQKKKRQMKERHRQEDSISSAMVIWNNQILPNWDTMKGTRRVRELWWQGLPPSVRGRVWSLAIGNELNITPELYEIFLSRAKEKWRSYSETSSVNDSESDGGASLADRESSLDLIKLDISRTFPSLFIFQKGGPYHDLLHSVLGAYTCYRPDIGYVQGMSFIAAVLILNLEEAEAFITFSNLLNKPCQMAFFRVDHDLMLKYFAAFEVFFEENLPSLFNHFQTSSLTPDLYLIDWIFTLYSKSLPLDVACRVWDVFCRDGEESLFRTGLGILRLYEDVLLRMDFIHMAQFLSRLPDDLQSHTLFTAMAATHMISRSRRWNQVFSALKDGTTDRNSSPALRS